MPCSNTAPPMMSRVEGLLFESDAWPGWWAQLDDFAGPDYGRVLARVRRRDCGIVTAYFVCGPGRAGSGWPKLTRPAGASPPRARHTDEYTACARALVGSRGRGRRGLVARLEEGTPPVQTPFAYGSIAIVIRHWFEIARQDEEQGAASSFDRFRVLCTAEPARHHRC